MNGTPLVRHLTKRVYTYIRDQDYALAIETLQNLVETRPNCRGFLSLLGHCQYSSGHFETAAAIYDQLLQLAPGNKDYRILLAQSLYRSDVGVDEVLSILEEVEDDNDAVIQLKLAIAFERDDIHNVENISSDICECGILRLINLGCQHYKQGRVKEALEFFVKAVEDGGYKVSKAGHGLTASCAAVKAEVVYNCALCCYELGEMTQGLQFIAAIVDNCASSFEGDVHEDDREKLRQSFLVEALNLKLAIEMTLSDAAAAKATLETIPRLEDGDRDPVTLYHSAIVDWTDHPEEAIRKLEHLVQNPPFPPQTVETLLHFYCCNEVGHLDSAATLVSEQPDLLETYLDRDTREYIEALSLKQLSPETCLHRLRSLNEKLARALRRRHQTQDPHYRQIAERHLSVLMSLGQCLYESGLYRSAEKLLLDESDLWGGDERWSTNMGHVLFVQGNRYGEAADLYGRVVAGHDQLLSVTPVVLANLCVSHIMNNANTLAEEMMQKVDAEEREIEDRASTHLCIINLVIGTLYCSKGNYDFGISRFVRSFDSVETNLDADTWHYSKRCLLAALVRLARQEILLGDERLNQILEFLNLVHVHGIDRDAADEKSIAQEAKAIQNAFLSLTEATRLSSISLLRHGGANPAATVTS